VEALRSARAAGDESDFRLRADELNVEEFETRVTGFENPQTQHCQLDEVTPQ
jgi:hypothetical protein